MSRPFTNQEGLIQRRIGPF